MGTAQGPPNLVDSGVSYGPILTKHSEPRMDDLLSHKNDGQAFFFLIKKKNVLAMLCSIQDLSSLTRD